jgi:hypothetical protein
MEGVLLFELLEGVSGDELERRLVWGFDGHLVSLMKCNAVIKLSS